MHLKTLLKKILKINPSKPTPTLWGKDGDYKPTFQTIYEKGIWNKSDPNTPLSGPGSSIRNTQNVKAFLDDFITKRDVTSVVDLGCGDLTWIQHSDFFNNPNIRYTGIDIVESLIEQHKQRFQDKDFYNKDITADELPPAELYIIREVIFHLHLDRIIQLFGNMQGRFRYLAITSCGNVENNDKLNQWHFAERNLRRSPFNITRQSIASVDERTSNRVFLVFDHEDFYL